MKNLNLLKTIREKIIKHKLKLEFLAKSTNNKI